jgi:IS30 family transposase
MSMQSPNIGPKQGCAGGGLCYGYEVVKHTDAEGEPIRGERTVNETQAEIVRRVFRVFAAGISPRAIAGRLRRDHPADRAMRVSQQAVYRWVYRDAAEGGDLFAHLRRRHRKRRKQGRYGTGRGLIPGRVSIAARPAIVGRRARFGDWEGDTLEGARGKGGLASLLERKSRFLLSAPLCDKSAAIMASKASRAFKRVPRHLRKTLTIDNGTEFAKFRTIEQQTGLAIFFADPYAAWQRGSNENANGLLRQYFPKGADLSAVSPSALASALHRLNHRPRKCLAYRSPHEVFSQACRGALHK